MFADGNEPSNSGRTDANLPTACAHMDNQHERIQEEPVLSALTNWNNQTIIEQYEILHSLVLSTYLFIVSN
jgi:hypothetical protein